MTLSNRNWVSILSLPLLACLPIACASEAGDSTDQTNQTTDNVTVTETKEVTTRASCADAAPGQARCFARVRTAAPGEVAPFATAPGGLNPADLISAYHVPASTSTATIAIVDAFDNPNAEADLGHYRSQFGLPACTTANGCFKKVNGNGGSTPPSSDTGWGEEIALDLDMASAICPSCKILLVEATSASFQALATAVNTAVSLGATVVSNSYGGGESSGETSFDSFYNHAGVAVFASTGDNGFGTSYPATAKGVIGVGGTTLTRASGTTRGWTETVWSGAGSGCSSVEAKPTWQNDTGCARRTVGDLSAVANPSTGVSVYDSFGTGSSGPWLVFGGTSVSSPLVAAIFASIGKGNKTGAFVWQNTSAFNDVTSGSNGSCSGSYLCTAKVGFDGPTGWGTPDATKLKALP